MEIAEHFYTDDPAVGHPDVRTRLPDTDYFFLGNGLVQAAVQLCRSGEGTPVGLLVLDPEVLGPKRAALTLEEETGLRGTMVEVRVGEGRFGPRPEKLAGGWEGGEGTPTVRVEWEAGPATVTERFSCPVSGEPEVWREVEVREDEEGSGTGFTLVYRVVEGEDGPAVEVRRLDRSGKGGSRGGGPAPSGWRNSGEADRYWASLSTARTGDPELDHLFRASRAQLPVVVDRRGRMDGSIWQYNLEWVRDQSHVAEALVRLGDTATAATMLARLLDEFVSPEGDTVDSGTRRTPDDVELDQNGELLGALATYVDWTGELDLVARRWDTVRALARFPLTSPFRHEPSGMLHNRREYWERHGVHGIRDGFELTSQLFVSVGLEGAAGLAEALGKDGDASRWREAAEELKAAFLGDPVHGLVEDGHFIKRRGLDGAWQRTIEMRSPEGLPPGIPLLEEGLHLLDPDTSSALPVVLELVDPEGDLAGATLEHVEELWDQGWTGGGYGRYHRSSEPDSPGAWPFPSLFAARAYAERGDGEKVRRVLRWLARVQGGVAGSWFENYGPRIAPPYPQVGIPPWTWAELVTLFLHHLLGVRPDLHGLTLRPRLLEGLNPDGMEASVRVRGHRLRLTVRRAEKEEPGAWVAPGNPEAVARKGAGGEPPGGERRYPMRDGAVRLPSPTSDLEIQLVC